MKPSDAALLTAVVIIVILFAAWFSRDRDRERERERERAGAAVEDFRGVGLYNHPYKNYPRYEGRGATWWDGDHRCTANCSQSPCTVWCR